MMLNSATVNQPRVDRWFFIVVGLLMIFLNFVAFGPSIIDPSGRRMPLPFTPLVAAQGVVSTAFLFVFLAQATLVATGRTDVHRRLGIIGALLAAALIVLGYFALVGEARRGFDLSGDLSSLPAPPGMEVASIMSPVIQLLLFGMLFGAGLLYRHRPELHKRLILLAVLGILSQPPIAHLITHWPALHPWAPLLFPVSSAVFLAPSAIHDKVVNGRIHPVSIWVPIAAFLVQAAFFAVIAGTPLWGAIAKWLVR
jgi:hypothetical protein